MKRNKKPIVLESFYNKNGLPETFFELRKETHQRLIDYKAKTGSYQKNAYAFTITFSEPGSEYLLQKNKEYLKILKTIPIK